MIVLLKSAPDTAEARRAVKLARDMAADIVLLQNAVYLAEKDRLEGFCGAVHAIDEDIRIRGIAELDKNVRVISHGGLVDLMADSDKVTGVF